MYNLSLVSSFYRDLSIILRMCTHGHTELRYFSLTPIYKIWNWWENYSKFRYRNVGKKNENIVELQIYNYKINLSSNDTKYLL